MYFLSVEPSTKNFALSVSRDDKVLRFRNVKSAKILEDAMIPAIDAILDAAGIKLEKLDGFAIGLGPGSFTSLRVGLSTIKAFAFAFNKPVVGVCTLDVLAHGVQDMDCDEICVLVDARRNMVYSALFTKTKIGLKLKGAYTLSDLGVVLDRVQGQTLFVGDALVLYRKDIEQAYAKCNSECHAIFADVKYAQPKAPSLAALAYPRLKKGKGDHLDKLLPMYLYASDCQVDRNKQ